MTGEGIILKYNRLSGNTIRVDTLRTFHRTIQNYLDSEGTGPFVPVVKGIYEKITKAIKQHPDNDLIKIELTRVNLKKLKRKEKKPVVKNVEAKKRPSKKSSIGEIPDEDLRYGLESNLPGGELKGLGFTAAGQQKIYDMITGMVLKLIQNGKELPWRKPWTIERILATNFKTQTVYKGANLYLLNLIAPLLYGKSGPYWLTYKQARELGGNIKEGATGFPVIYYNIYYSVNKPEKKTITKEQFDELTPEQKKERDARELWTINYYNVFSQEDIEGIKFPVPGKKRDDATPIETAQQIVDGMPQRPEIFHHDAGRAFYSPDDDHIKLPPIKYFNRDQEYYSTLFHELVHSTGHPKRLDRFETNKKIAPLNDYAFEELIAELGASYLNAQAGTLYFTLNNSATYLKGWQKKLEDAMKGDNKFFLKAASKAAKATDFILDIKEEKTEVVKAPKSKRASKSPRPPVERKERGQAPAEHSKKHSLIAGFTTADKAPSKPADLFTLPGTIGVFLGELQRYKLEIVIAGETHSSKSELGKQIADAFISHGLKTCLVDWEAGGLESRDTIDSIARNVKPENKSKLYVSAEVPKDLDAIKDLHKHFDVVVIDSGTKLNQVTNAWIDELREEYPETIWVILMQQNAKGGTRGGTAAEFDAPIVIYTYRPDQSDQLKNYATMFKNRSNKTGMNYLIATKKIQLPDYLRKGTVKKPTSEKKAA